MAGNKFRNYRNNKESNDEKNEKEENNNVERNKNVVLTKDYNILIKAKEEKRYHSEQIYHEGTITKVIDIIENENMKFVKIETKQNNKLTFGYIAVKDKNGNFNVQTFESNGINLEEKKPLKYNLETYGSIKLGDAKLSNNENTQNNQEDLNSHKKNDELMKKMIYFLTEKSNEGEKEISNPNNGPQFPKFNNDLKNKNNHFKDEENLKVDEPKIKDNIPKLSKINSNDLIYSFISKSNIYVKSNKINLDSFSDKKKHLVNNYLAIKKLKNNKELNKTTNNNIELPNLPLEPKHKKGVQVIYRPISWLKWAPFIYKKFKIGHIFIRYYDKEKGTDNIIESGSSNKLLSIDNLIEFGEFKKEELEKYEYNVLQDEELSDDISYETVKDILIKSYNNNGECNRGRYGRYNCCFQTAEEVMKLFGKSGEFIKQLHEEKILFKKRKNENEFDNENENREVIFNDGFNPRIPF